MVAVFLKTEIASYRFRDDILAILDRHGRDPRIVEQPDTASPEENAYRRAALGEWRLVTDAVARIRRGIEAFHVGNGGFWYLADALCGGAVFPELILVGQRKGGPLVILEGHVRATAYLLRP